MLIAYLLLSTAAGLAIGYLIANRATQRHMQKCAELQSQLSSSEARLKAAQQQAEAQKERLAARRKEQAEQNTNTNETIVPENEISEDEQDEGSAFSISM